MHDGQNWLRAQAERRVRTVLVIRPEYTKGKFGDIRISDYITVPRLSTIGTFTLMDMLDHDSVVNTIKVYNEIKGPIKSTPIGKRPSRKALVPA